MARSPQSRTGAILLLLAALLASFFSAPAAAAGRERILLFDSEIWIHRDGSMTVRETIEVEATGDRIKRGIYRDFPTVYNDRRGTRVVVDFDIEEVARDGASEPWRTERHGNGIRVYIGDKDMYVRPGPHTYTITYRTNRQLGHFEGFDELYWNVTGNGWAFDIERARAIVHLPEGARVRDYAAYTGAAGSRGQDFTYDPLTDGTVRFTATRGFGPGEGLTIAVAWPAGFVERPGGTKKLLYFFSDNGAMIAGAAGLGLLLLYYSFVWAKVGRDPDKGVIVPQYKPPSGLTPAGARYVMEFAFDDKVFTAAVVNMAVKGFLTIKENDDGVFTLATTGKAAPLSPGERAVAGKLFSGGRGAIELEQKNHSVLQAAQKALRAKLRTEFEKSHFVHNTGYFAPGVALSLLALGLIALASDDPAAAGFITLWLAVWSVAIYFLFRQVQRAWRAVLGGGIGGAVRAIVVTAFAVPFFVGEIMGLIAHGALTTVGGALALVAMQTTNLVFYHLLKAPTLLGRRLMDQVEGFKEYLSVAEQDRLNMLNPPERTPDLFEKFLPYALALGVEQEWSEQFAGVLAHAGTSPRDAHRHAYRPGWYAGRNLDRGLGGFTAALGGAFAGAIASASTAPGSSSGSGGGGSSGGGGGGGGGGGW